MNIKLYAKIKTLFIFDKNKRKEKRNQIIRNYKIKKHTEFVEKQAKSVGKNLWVSAPVTLTQILFLKMKCTLTV